MDRQTDDMRSQDHALHYSAPRGKKRLKHDKNVHQIAKTGGVTVADNNKYKSTTNQINGVRALTLVRSQLPANKDLLKTQDDK